MIWDVTKSIQIVFVASYKDVNHVTGRALVLLRDKHPRGIRKQKCSHKGAYVHTPKLKQDRGD